MVVVLATAAARLGPQRGQATRLSMRISSRGRSEWLRADEERSHVSDPVTVEEQVEISAIVRLKGDNPRE
jgi:hypothetical protein